MTRDRPEGMTRKRPSTDSAIGSRLAGAILGSVANKSSIAASHKKRTAPYTIASQFVCPRCWQVQQTTPPPTHSPITGTQLRSQQQNPHFLASSIQILSASHFNQAQCIYNPLVQPRGNPCAAVHGSAALVGCVAHRDTPNGDCHMRVTSLIDHALFFLLPSTMSEIDDIFSGKAKGKAPISSGKLVSSTNPSPKKDKKKQKKRKKSAPAPDAAAPPMSRL